MNDQFLSSPSTAVSTTQVRRNKYAKQTAITILLVFGLPSLIMSSFLGPNAFWIMPLGLIAFCLLFWIPMAAFHYSIQFVKRLIAHYELGPDLAQLRQNRIVQFCGAVIAGIILLILAVSIGGN